MKQFFLTFVLLTFFSLHVQSISQFKKVPKKFHSAKYFDYGVASTESNSVISTQNQALSNPTFHSVENAPTGNLVNMVQNLHLNKPRVSNPRPIHCVDENNRQVDWVIFYKLPRVHVSPNPLVVNGEAYMTVSSEDIKRFEKMKAWGGRKMKASDGKMDESKVEIDGKKSAKEVRQEIGKEERKSMKNEEKIGPAREHYPYYSYDVSADQEKNLMNELKEVLMKQLVKGAKEQIDMEKNTKIEEQAKILKSELDGGRVKRDIDIVDTENTVDSKYLGMENLKNIDTERDMETTDYAWDKEREDMYKDFDTTESPHWQLDFSDSIRVLNNLLQARALRDKRVLKTPDAGKLNRKDFFEIYRAIELLNNNSEMDYSEDTTSSEEVDHETPAMNNPPLAGNHDSTSETEENLSDSGKESGNSEEKNIPQQSLSPQWTLSKYSVRDPASLPGRILSPFLFNESYAPEFSTDGVKILYNDQTPTSTTVKFGHSKGLVLGNSDGGIWIVHSVPHFVDDAQKDYTYPHTGLMYGQNFLCLSLNRTELNDVGNNLGHNQVFKYSTHLSDSNKPLYPTLASVIDGTYKTNGDNYYRSTIHTRFGSVPFQTFAKTRELEQDLYENIARDLNTNLLVETWPNGPGRLRSDCKQPGRLVENVEGINASVVVFASTHDHAKWTISFQSSVGRKMNEGCLNQVHSSMENVQNSSETSGDALGNISDATVEEIVTKKNIEDEPKNQVSKSSEYNIASGNDFESNSDDIAQRTMVNINEGILKSIHDDANQLSNEIDPIPQSSQVLDDEMNTELSNAEEGASPDDSPVGEMERFAQRLFSRRYDLDGNMNNLDPLDDANSKEEPVEEDEDGMEELRGQTVGVNHAKRTKRYANMGKDSTMLENFGGFNVPTESFGKENIIGPIFNRNMFENRKTLDLSDASIVPTEGSTYEVEDVGHFVCNGDINRAEDQLKRGGGSVCMDNAVVWGMYHSLVSAVEPCKQQ